MINDSSCCLLYLFFTCSWKENYFILLSWVVFFPPKYLEIKLVSWQIFQIWILYTGKPFYEINKNHVQWRVQKNALRNLPIWTFFVWKKYKKKYYLLACTMYLLSAYVVMFRFCNQLFPFLKLLKNFSPFWKCLFSELAKLKCFRISRRGCNSWQQINEQINFSRQIKMSV